MLIGLQTTGPDPLPICALHLGLESEQKNLVSNLHYDLELS